MKEKLYPHLWQSMSDWSGMPDVYVTKVECQSGLIWRIEACSVPMAIGPEVRLVNAKEMDEAQAKIARLTEALDEKQDGGKDFWMKWTQKRLESRNAMFLRDAKLALAGDMRALRNRVDMMEAEPMPIVLSAALQENADE